MLGELPIGWSTTRLGEVASRVLRRVSGAQQDVLMITSTGGFVPQSEKYGRFMAGESLSKYTDLHRGEFAYNKGNSKTYPYGCVFQLDGYRRAAVPNVYISFAIDPNRLDHGFAKQLFGAGWLNDHLARVISSGVRGNGLLNVGAGDFFAAPLPRPPLPEQKKIAAILSSVDEAIQATLAVIDQTRRVKEGLLQELLTRGIGHTRFKQTEIGEIPEGWEVARLGALSPRLAGRLLVEPHKFFADEGVPIVFGQNIGDGRIEQDSLRRISFAADADNAHCRVRAGDLLTVRVGRPGATAVVPPELDGCHFASAMRVSGSPRFVSEWLCYCMNSAVVRRQIDAASYVSAQKQFNIGDAANFKIPVPPVPEQQILAEALNDVDIYLFGQCVALDSLRTTKSALLQDLLTGRVRVTV